MARKSNKTAHVLNLLAGHDAAKDADDQASIESEASGGSAAQTASGGAAPQAAQANAASGSAVSQSDSDGTAPQAVSGRQPRQAAPQTAAGRQPRQAAPQTAAGRQPRQAAAGSAATQRAPGRPAARQPGGSAAASAAAVSGNAGPAAAPAPVVSAQNNIAVIDKTGEDPVAELIQQKLSSEFEKQMKQSQPEASSAKDITPVPEMDAGSAEDSEYPSDALPLTEAEEILDDIDLEGLLLSDAEPIAPEPEQASSMNEINADAMILDEDAAEAFDDISGADSFPEPEDESLILSAAEPLPESTPVSQPVTVQDAEAAVPAQETAVSPQPDRTPASAPEANLVQEAAPILQSASEPAVSAPAPLPTPEPEPEPDFAAINVMEHIVRDKIIYFMRQFDVCTCDRCKADVTALTLNGLMPKYIVTTKAAVDPLLSYYTNRLISDVTVEATKSCMIVKENPRH